MTARLWGRPTNRNISHITCPMWGSRMRLALAEPEKDASLLLTFACECEFQSGMSDSVLRELETL